MRRLAYRTSVRENLAQIPAYITRETNDRKVGAAFIAMLRAQCEKCARLDATPGTARPERHPDVRSTPCQGYGIFFRYRADTSLGIVNLLHGSRDIDSLFDVN